MRYGAMLWQLNSSIFQLVVFAIFFFFLVAAFFGLVDAFFSLSVRLA